ncbi:Diphthamide biosynthesis protein 3 [Cyphellophora attinorum]|uniref:Diphthamide biosynthesis protein 3 n=1 Tax=Cyphellophora attinorum TaxID=1664694 RepID=A0A0N1HX41_9EURO|nr:Diphthamide biosynthesis protein 3 [Phialophora attinorum]KPI45000.1 Diphthamide biosynthesis protein 3 [Phialophora attinorum]
MSSTQTQTQTSSQTQQTTVLKGASPTSSPSGSSTAIKTSDSSTITTKPTDPSTATPPAKTDNPNTDETEIYDEIEIEDMTYDSTLRIYHYPCPCGDRFEILVSELREGNDIAVCPGCSLTIRVIYEVEDLVQEDG